MNDFSFLISILLVLGVVFVNGFTDAPNAITTAVCTRLLTLKSACIICGIFNFLGSFLFSTLSGKVYDTVLSIVSLRSQQSCLIAVTSALITTIAFAIITWLFKLPSSESHALLCSLLGASFFFGQATDIFRKCGYIVLCMIISCVLAFTLSFFVGIVLIKRKINGKKALIPSMCLVSLMHGAQDGQKFVGALMFLSAFTDTPVGFFTKAPLSILVSVFMLLGSLLGGKRIIETMGKRTAELNYTSSCASDFSSILTMVTCSLLGLPVSTGNIRIFSIIGGSVSIKQHTNRKIAGLVLSVSLLTLPICFFMGYFIAFATSHLM